jgi:hypothetical protein
MRAVITMVEVMNNWPRLLLSVWVLGFSIGSESAQVCRPESRIPATTPTAEFTDHRDGTISHHATGLMWAKCTEGLTGLRCASGTAQNHDWQQSLDLLPAVPSPATITGGYLMLRNCALSSSSVALIRALIRERQFFRIPRLRFFGRPRRLPTMPVVRGMCFSTMVTRRMAFTDASMRGMCDWCAQRCLSVIFSKIILA